ncbi:hypothetical protein B0W81_04450 [Prochlorococcus sp. HOT_208_60]|nr:hypothetical protein B0W81_04450 [Prochlorococcus sp. HOT_208_60]
MQMRFKSILKKKREIRILLEKILPIKIFRTLFTIYGIIKRPQKSFSQKGEDIIVHAFFGRRPQGFYLDIGAFHPRWISNTCLLHQSGWEGVAIDLDQYKLNVFKLLRGKKVKTIHSAVVPYKQEKSLINVYKFFSKRGWSDVDTLDLDTAEYLKQNGRGDYVIDKVPSIDINSLLEKLPKVDFLNIDIEGLDTDIVTAINLNKFKIDVILFEDNKNYGGQPLLIKKLKNHGYFHLFTSGGSVCFALKSSIIQK